MYELVIVWSTGEKNIYEYKTREEAEKGGDNFKTAFGYQVSWFGVREKQITAKSKQKVRDLK